MRMLRMVCRKVLMESTAGKLHDAVVWRRPISAFLGSSAFMFFKTAYCTS